MQSRGPGCMGLVAVVCKFSCSMAGGILVPVPGIESVFLALAGRFLTTGPPGRSSDSLLLVILTNVHLNLGSIV